MPGWTEPRKYDDVDWHVEGALNAGQPEDNAATHIGLYLGWLIRRDLVDRHWFVDDHVAAIKSGEMTGSDLADFIDGKLVSDMLTPEGAGFTSWYYERYLGEYGDEFPESGDYEIIENDETTRVVMELLDGRIAEWREAGRPEPASRVPPKIEIPAGLTIGIGEPSTELLNPEARQLLEETLSRVFPQAQFVDVSAPPTPHEAPQIEALFPTHLTGPPTQISSTSATRWRNALLNRVVKDLEIKPSEVMVANAMCGRGERSLTMQITTIPGIDRATLWENVPRLSRVGGGLCDMRQVAGRNIDWCVYGDFIKAAWASDGMILWASARNADLVEAAIAALP
jgi:hypothetical protein